MAEQVIDFNKWTEEDVLDLLNTAMDDGEWHTPLASDLYIHTSNGHAIYGRINISKHSTYHDVEHWFNINCDSVNIWREEYVRNKAKAKHYRPIYNIQKLGEKLNKHKIQTNQQ